MKNYRITIKLVNEDPNNVWGWDVPKKTFRHDYTTSSIYSLTHTAHHTFVQSAADWAKAQNEADEDNLWVVKSVTIKEVA